MKTLERDLNALEQYVYEWLEYKTEEDDGHTKSVINDLMNGGCQGGMVGDLIYYDDTHKFYDKYYYEIESLREELEFQFGEPLKPDGDLKNWFAWLGFEETARSLGLEMGYDI